MELELGQTKTVLAGSSKGLGLAIATAFVEEKSKVWLSGRSETALESARSTLKNCNTTVCDLETEQGREKLFSDVASEWGGIDTLVLNIGSGRSKAQGVSTPPEEVLRMINLNLITHTSLVRLFTPLLERSTNPSIISISSIAGEIRLPPPANYSYGAAKAGLNFFCMSIAEELAHRNIRYVVISPGNVLVPGGTWEQRLKENPERVESYIKSAVPLKRFGTAKEISDTVLFFASKRASFCTGTVIRVDGGQTPCL